MLIWRTELTLTHNVKNKKKIKKCKRNEKFKSNDDDTNDNFHRF